MSEDINAKKQKPNIVYIVMDDMGFSDLGCYGSEIQTPHLDRLAENGLRYNNFNATPVCSPTRACLLTGRNHNSVGMSTIAHFDLGEGSNVRGRITPAAATAAEILKLDGYSTFALGKWHLAPSHHVNPAGPFDHWPLGKGFERYYGFLEGFTDQYAPELVYDNHMINAPKRPGYHLSEDLADHAIQFVADQVSVYPEKPFFLYLAFGAMHSPHQAPKAYIDRYEGMYDDGWDRIRERRFARQKQLGIIPADAELAPHNPGVKAWDGLSAIEKRVFARFMETYAGYLTHTDEQIGRVIRFLESVGELDNTLIAFISDNGASKGALEGFTNYMKYFNYEEERAEDHLALLDEMGGPDTFLNYPSGWSQVCNTPFKYYKMDTHNGGVRVPLILHWPEAIRDRGGIRGQFHHVIDITPTIMDLLHIAPPQTHRGVQQMPIHGISMAYTFDDAEAATRRQTQYFNFNGNRAIWREGWKATVHHEEGVPLHQDRWELYHVDQDFSEIRDLADQCPEKLRELQDVWFTEAGKYDVFPLIENHRDMFGLVSLESPANRNTFVYYPGLTHVSAKASPPIVDRSYTIAIPIERSGQGDEGVLVSAGTIDSGYTLYILKNRLVYEYNYVGTVYRIESDIEMPAGRSTVRFEFKKTGSCEGTGRLYIDDHPAGEVYMPKTLPVWITYRYLEVGDDSSKPVSRSYREKDGFSFAGKIEKVVFRLENDKGGI